MAIKTLRDIEILENTNVLVRADFDVPINKAGQVENTTRIEKCLPTIKYLLDKGTTVALLTKIGRPEEGRRTSTKILLPILEKLLDTNVEWAHDPLNPEHKSSENSAKILLFENIGFYKWDKAKDEEATKTLVKPFNLYVNEAFAKCHRSDASITLAPKFLPSCAGFRLFKEYETLTNLIKNPKRPLIAILGGAKSATKAPLIKDLAKTFDKILVGGKLSADLNSDALSLSNLLNAIDSVDGKDIGQRSIDLFKKEISKAKTIVWNGPMGMFESGQYIKGTREVARYISKSNAFKVVGGGDTIAALTNTGHLDKMDFISTGGGAMLTLLAGMPMPGIEALEQKPD